LIRYPTVNLYLPILKSMKTPANQSIFMIGRSFTPPKRFSTFHTSILTFQQFKFHDNCSHSSTCPNTHRTPSGCLYCTRQICSSSSPSAHIVRYGIQRLFASCTSADGPPVFQSPLKGYENVTVQCQNCGNISAHVYSRWWVSETGMLETAKLTPMLEGSGLRFALL